MIGYENVEISDEKENVTMYSFDTKLEIRYIFYDGASTEEIIDVHVEVEYLLDEIFSIIDVYKINESEYESEG